jgi:hypothetical protein
VELCAGVDPGGDERRGILSFQNSGVACGFFQTRVSFWSKIRFMKKLFVFAIVLVGLGLSQVNSWGQNPPTPPTTDPDDDGIAGFWELETVGGRFVARIDHISSVSQHEYLIDGSVKVFECTVSVSGGLIGRFYYIEPVSSTVTGSNTYDRLKEVANKVSNRAGAGDIEVVVTKNYPTTTHAKTSEYRFKNKDTIARIYDHAHRVVAEERGRGRGNKLTIRE